MARNFSRERTRVVRCHHRSLSSAWRAVSGILFLFGTLFGIAGGAVPLSNQTNELAASHSKALPSKIETTEGKTYNSVKLLRGEPDGVVVEYRPECGGTGLAKLKFAVLAEWLQKQFGYDKEEASVFEVDQAQVVAEFSKKLQRDEATKTSVRNAMERVEAVIVEMANPKVEYAYYDPAGPRPALISPGMSGSTRPSYFCSIKPDESLTYDQKQEIKGGPSCFHFKTVKVSVGLLVTITLPNNPYDKLREHEEGHRKINEHFYSAGAQAAKRAVAPIIGKEFIAYSTNLESAKMEAAASASLAAWPEYFKYTREPAANANKFYDQLTDHGRNQTDSDKAAREAFERYNLPVPD